MKRYAVKDEYTWTELYESDSYTAAVETLVELCDSWRDPVVLFDRQLDEVVRL